MSVSRPKRVKGVLSGQPKSEFVTWRYDQPLKTPDPENDDVRAFSLPTRLREAGYEELAQAFEELWGRDVGKTATQAALLIAGHMGGPSLRFAGRPARSSPPSDFVALLQRARTLIAEGKDRRVVVAELINPLYKDRRTPGVGWPGTVKAAREKLHAALKRAP